MKQYCLCARLLLFFGAYIFLYTVTFPLAFKFFKWKDRRKSK